MIIHGCRESDHETGNEAERGKGFEPLPARHQHGQLHSQRPLCRRPRPDRKAGRTGHSKHLRCDGRGTAVWAGQVAPAPSGSRRWNSFSARSSFIRGAVTRLLLMARCVRGRSGWGKSWDPMTRRLRPMLWRWARSLSAMTAPFAASPVFGLRIGRRIFEDGVPGLSVYRECEG